MKNAGEKESGEMEVNSVASSRMRTRVLERERERRFGSVMLTLSLVKGILDVSLGECCVIMEGVDLVW